MEGRSRLRSQIWPSLRDFWSYSLIPTRHICFNSYTIYGLKHVHVIQRLVGQGLCSITYWNIYCILPEIWYVCKALNFDVFLTEIEEFLTIWTVRHVLTGRCWNWRGKGREKAKIEGEEETTETQEFSGRSFNNRWTGYNGFLSKHGHCCTSPWFQPIATRRSLWDPCSLWICEGWYCRISFFTET